MNDKKKKYTDPDFEIVEFQNSDIITVSFDESNEDGENW